MDTDAARGALERPSGAPPGASRDAPVASTSDPEIGTGAPHSSSFDAIESMTFPAFPHEPYGIQLELMRSLYATLRRGGIGVFESPTGTGKTLSVLCSALQWLEDERRANARGASSGGKLKLSGHESSRSRSAQVELADASEPDWLRDFASNKRGRDAADREQRRKARRAEARRRAAEADRAFFAGARSVGGAFGGGGKNPEARADSRTVSRRGKAAAEAAAVAAYAAAVSRGASRDDAIEEAEFLADDWSDETGAATRAVRGDDTSSDEEADFVSKSNAVQARFKRVRSGAHRKTHTEKLVGVDVSDSDDDDFPPTQVIF